jgi:tetratricopeptide (TPR) repeat protein
MKRRDRARAQLASTLLEQSRAKEAADIQEALIKENSPILSDSNYAASLWNNLGNSYRVLGKLDDARNAFERALQFNSDMNNDEK